MRTLTSERIAQHINFKRPIIASQTQPFGANAVPLYKEMGMLGHNGIDYGIKTGAKVYSPINAVISSLQDDAGYGTHIWSHSDEMEIDGITFKLELVYGHLSKFADIKVGTKVEAGDIIAYSGNSGYSTGPHLHFGVRPLYKQENGSYVSDANNGYRGYIDPAPLIKGWYVDLEKLYEQYNGRLIKSVDSPRVYLLKDQKKYWFPNEEILWSHDYRLWGTGEEEIVNLSPHEVTAIPSGEDMDKGEYWDYLQKIINELKNYVKQS